MPSLIPFFLFLPFIPHLRRKIIVQFHTPLRYNNLRDSEGKLIVRSVIHNLMYVSYLSIFFKILLFLVSTKYHVFNRDTKMLVKKSKLIQSPVDQRFLRVDTTRKSTNIFKVAFVGRYSYQKGIDILVSAINKYNKNYYNRIKFFFFGEGEYEENVNLLERKYGNIKNMHFVNHFELPESLSKMNAVIIPSRYESSTSPLVLKEALSLGLIALVSSINNFRSKNFKKICVYFDLSEKGINKSLITLLNMGKKEIADRSTSAILYAKNHFLVKNYVKNLEKAFFKEE